MKAGRSGNESQKGEREGWAGPSILILTAKSPERFFGDGMSIDLTGKQGRPQRPKILGRGRKQTESEPFRA